MDGIGLELNRKTGIYPLRNGIDFLGFHSYLTDQGGCVQKLRRENIDRIRARVNYWREAYPAGLITKEKIIDKFRGWDAFASYGDTYALRLKYAKQVSEIIGAEVKPRRKINSTNAAKAKRKLRQARNIYKKKHPELVNRPLFSIEPAPDDIPPWM